MGSAITHEGEWIGNKWRITTPFAGSPVLPHCGFCGRLLDGQESVVLYDCGDGWHAGCYAHSDRTCRHGSTAPASLLDEVLDSDDEDESKKDQ